ncbi:MAG: TonB-dependent receptor [Gammaproteobacteria bacterium]|nr:TonB-dependent receptor [Gammaproteobacteria bacterium]MDH5214914.1 TonB-dependent receptor [Gammaproteobacteria bacterium]
MNCSRSVAGARMASVCGIALLTTFSMIMPPVLMMTSQVAVAQAPELEEIIVTARKREENLLEIPESLTNFSAQIIERGNINGLEDIGLLVPNLYMSRRLDGFPNVSIRGLGGFGNTQGVGFYLDDVQIFSDASSRFGDLERIEVLKGPQGILYGGANIGGAVKFVAKRPDPEAFAGRIKVSAGEDGYLDGEVQLNMPLNENWAARLFAFSSTNDSYLVNPNSARQNGGVNSNDADVGQIDESGVRLTLAGDFSDRFSMYAAIRYNDLDGPNNIWNVELDGNLEYTNVVDTSFNPRHKRETTAASLEFAYQFDNSVLTSITSYTDTNSDRQTDLDNTQEFVIDLFRPHRLDVLTQELRLASTGDGALQWQIGAYYLDYERDMNSQLLVRGGFGFLDPTCCPVPPPLDSTESELLVALPFENSLQERDQAAIFADLSYRWSNWELAGGVRVDDWQSDRTNRDTNISGKQSETEVLGRASLARFSNDERTMVYGLISQGFEPGDFNLSNFTTSNSLFGYGPEDATQFEIGYKGQLADGRVILTLAAFYIDYNNRQFELQTTDPSGTVVEGIINAGDSEQTGLEADLQWSLNDAWTLSAGVGFVDAEWDSGTISPISGADITGMTPPNTADFSGTVALDYSQDVGNDTRWQGRLQVRHKSDASTNAQFFDAPGDDFPFWENPGFTVVDVGAWVDWQSWQFGVHVENVFDEEYYIDVQEFPNFAGTAQAGAPGAIIIGTLEQPRRIVATAQFRF